MPSKSKKQHKFMSAVANNPKFAEKVGVPTSVGKEFADTKKYNRGDAMKQGYKGKKFQHGGVMDADEPITAPGPNTADPVGMANPRTGVTNNPSPLDSAETTIRGSVDTYSPPGSPVPPEIMERIKTKRKARRQEGARTGRGRKAGGPIKSYTRGGGVRGAGKATKGVRPCRMITMKGS